MSQLLNYIENIIRENAVKVVITDLEGKYPMNRYSRSQTLETINEFYKDFMNIELAVYRSVLNFNTHFNNVKQ